MDFYEFHHKESAWLTEKERELGMPADEYRELHRHDVVVELDGFLGSSYAVYRDGTATMTTMDGIVYISPEALVSEMADGSVRDLQVVSRRGGE